jgi:hypothetical protein
MRFILGTTVAIALAVTWTYGQATTSQTSQCTLKVAQAPAVRGVKLGMKVDDVLAMFPGSREDIQVKNALTDNEISPKFGVTSFGVAPTQFGGKERFIGISSYYFTFLDGRMVRYGVLYPRPPWPRAEDFVNKIASAFQLSQASNWAIDEQGQRNLTCDGFRVQAMVRDGRGSVVIMTSDDPYKIARDRKAAAEEKEREEFKP